MKARPHHLLCLFALASAVGTLSLGCSGNQSLTPTASAAEFPAWTQRETWTEQVAGQTFVYAVGMDEGLEAGEDNARAAASARAREALARYLETSVRTFLSRGGVRQTIRASSSTSASAGADAGTAAQSQASATESTDQLVRASREVSEQSLHGVEVREFARSERRGVLYAQARVDLAQVLRAFDAVPALSEGDRAYVRQNHAEAEARMRAALEESRSGRR